ncbi:MAG TPA: peptide chain release factor N(5)-glutamine methyltransferase [Stellaceae bacterium]
MTAAELLTAAAGRLVEAGIENPRREARLLLNLALGIDANARLPEREIAPADAALFETFVARRAGHEPYSRIAGRREFWSVDFALSPDTLDPRPDSETLIEAALERIADRAATLSVVDFGTGTGALLLALLSELPNATGIGVDISAGAVETARRNAAALGLSARARFVLGRWGEGLTTPADVIVTNPPYISAKDMSRLPPEVREFDPAAALDGGPDGLSAYRELALDLKRLLSESGIALCEIGAGQAPAVTAIMAASGLDLTGSRADLAGIERCLVFEQRKKVGKSRNNGLMNQKIVGMSGNSH